MRNREWEAAVTGELCWAVPAADRPAGIPVVPLVMEGLPGVALPYLHREIGAELRSVPEAAFVVTDSRSLPAGSPGRALIGPLRVVDDIEGTVFADRLLEQELRKHPPSRALADSRLLRREHWWWLPRMLVCLERVDRTVTLPARTDPRRDAVLIRDGTGLRVDTVRADDWSRSRVGLRALGGDPLRGDGGPAVALGHLYTVPDLERWEMWRRQGVLRGDELAVAGELGDPEVALGPLRLLERIRRQRDLGRACRKGIAAAEAGLRSTARDPE